mmetsp:Transcript_53044/g.98143  ORF Transcript_53044/g.98143 Transcript_53044/m.98143 type:complete len:234 (-) Transcript_53044:75-776(-)
MVQRSQRRVAKQAARCAVRVALCTVAGLFIVLRPVGFVPVSQVTEVRQGAGSLQQSAVSTGSGAAVLAALATAGAAGLKQGSAKYGAAIAAAVLVGGLATVRSPTAHTRAACQSGEEVGDPSLTMLTNVKLDNKKELMMDLSKAVASCLGKPESYVAVCVKDGEDIIWGGSDDPCALCTLYSLGSINLENNKALSAQVASLMEKHKVPANRIYINFFDVPRENCGYNGATFAG